MAYAMFIDYEYCSGCHTCEVACQKELGLRPDEFGIECKEIGPLQLSAKYWQKDNLPVPTDLCNACIGRLEKNKPASCALHCQSDCMRVGTLEEISPLVKSKHQVLYVLIEGQDRSKEVDNHRGPSKAKEHTLYDDVPPMEREYPEYLGAHALSKNSLVKMILKNEKACSMLEALKPGLTQDPQLMQAAAMGVTLSGIAKAAPDMLDQDTLSFLDRQLRIITDVAVEPLAEGPSGLSAASKVKDILNHPAATALLETLAPGSTDDKALRSAAKMGFTLERVQKMAPDKINEYALAYLDFKLRQI